MSGPGIDLSLRQKLPFDPAILFADGRQGAWFDPSDRATLFEDSAGTIPAAVNGPVGRMADKSGRGNHAVQSTDTARPMLRLDANGRAYLAFDGVDDILTAGPVGSIGAEVSTIALAARLRSGTGHRAALTIGKQAVYANLAAANRWGGYNGMELPTSHTMGGNSLLIMRSRAPNDVDFFTNGHPVETRTSGTFYGSRIPAIGGAQGANQFAALDFYGAVAALSVMGGAQLQRLRSFLGHKAGLIL